MDGHAKEMLIKITVLDRTLNVKALLTASQAFYKNFPPQWNLNI